MRAIVAAEECGLGRHFDDKEHLFRRQLEVVVVRLEGGQIQVRLFGIREVVAGKVAEITKDVLLIRLVEFLQLLRRVKYTRHFELLRLQVLTILEQQIEIVHEILELLFDLLPHLVGRLLKQVLRLAIE